MKCKNIYCINAAMQPVGNGYCVECSRDDVPDRDAEIAALKAENAALQASIRKHRAQRGDDRCWLDDEELYRSLPEGFTPPARDSSVELENCRRFIACRHNPATEYVSPEREIERLLSRLTDVQAVANEIIARLHGEIEALRAALLPFAAAAGWPGRLLDSISEFPKQLDDDVVLGLGVKVAAWRKAVELTGGEP